MKRIAILISAIVIATSFCACGNAKAEYSKPSESSSSKVTSGTVEAGRVINVSLVKITGDIVNIRDNSSTDSNVLKVAVAGECYELTKSGSEWHEIVYEGNKAYVSASYSKVETYSQDEAEAILSAENNESSESSENSDVSENSGSDEDSENLEDSSETSINKEDGEA